MPYQVEYFHPRVLAEIESWPVDVLADYARLTELLAEYGPNLRLPHSRALGEGCLSSGRVAVLASVVRSMASCSVSTTSWFMRSSKRHKRLLTRSSSWLASGSRSCNMANLSYK